MTYVGIDPGLTGAIVLINDRDGYLLIDMPLKAKNKFQRLTSKGGGELDIAALVAAFKHVVLSPANEGEVYVVIEKQFVMPNQGLVSSGKTMMNYGIILGIMNALQIPYSIVDAKVWKKSMIWRRSTLLSNTKKSAIKASSIEQALVMFPKAKQSIYKAMHHNRAEALLLAAYCRKNYRTLKAMKEG